MRSWLVVGASGLLGAHVQLAAQRGGKGVVGTYSGTYPHPDLLSLDLREPGVIRDFLVRLQPDVVIYCAGALPVDACERRPSWATAINATAACEIRIVMPARSLFVYISSDFVFDGEAGPYSEDGLPNPLNTYGRTKLLGERCGGPLSLVIRTSMFYGFGNARGTGFLASLTEALTAGREVEVPSDEIGSPTLVSDLADAVLGLIEAGDTGIRNVAGPEHMSRYSFASRAAAHLGFDAELVLPVRSRELGREAIRPLRCGLVSDSAEAILRRRMLNVQEGLEQAREEWVQ